MVASKLFTISTKVIDGDEVSDDARFGGIAQFIWSPVE